MKQQPAVTDRPLSASRLLDPLRAEPSTWPRAIGVVSEVLGPGVRGGDRTIWDLARSAHDSRVRVELCGPPRLYASIVDSSKQGLRAVRMIDIYDQSGLEELRLAVADLAARIAPLRPSA